MCINLTIYVQIILSLSLSLPLVIRLTTVVRSDAVVCSIEFKFRTQNHSHNYHLLFLQLTSNLKLDALIFMFMEMHSAQHEIVSLGFTPALGSAASSCDCRGGFYEYFISVTAVSCLRRLSCSQPFMETDVTSVFARPRSHTLLL
jgi:hypothetical protein